MKEPEIKRREEEKKERRDEPGEPGEQGFQINYWSGVRWTFNLTNQLPNYTSAARIVYPLQFRCVCVAGEHCV